MNSFGRAIKDFCRRLGFDLVRFDRRPCKTNRPPVGDMRTILEDLKGRRLKCKNILDVGANEGRWSKLPPSTGLVFIAMLVILVLIAVPTVSERISIGTEVLKGRWTQENRSDDIKNFLAGTTLIDWIIGRGAIGTYDPGDRYAGRDVFHERVVVDVGWLCLVLKGGLILVVLVILVPVASAIEAFFKSQENPLTSACACIVFLWLVRLLYQGFFSTYPHMILLWLCVGRCLSISGNSRPR